MSSQTRKPEEEAASDYIVNQLKRLPDGEEVNIGRLLERCGHKYSRAAFMAALRRIQQRGGPIGRLPCGVYVHRKTQRGYDDAFKACSGRSQGDRCKRKSEQRETSEAGQL